MTPTPYNTRTNPHHILCGTTTENTVSVGLTTRCSMRCPNCTIDVPGVAARGEARDMTLDELHLARKHLTGLRRIHVTGGEPTFHPNFAHFVATLAYGCDPTFTTLETNGWGYRKHRSVIGSAFDLVFITHYQKDAIYPGSPDNTEVIELAQEDLGDKLIVEEPVRHFQSHLTILGTWRRARKEDILVKEGDRGHVCDKWFSPGLGAGYYNGKVYACCVSVGIDPGLGVPLTADWRRDMTRLPMGCAACTFRKGGPAG